MRVTEFSDHPAGHAPEYAMLRGTARGPKAPHGQAHDEAGGSRPVSDGWTRLDLVDRMRIEARGAEPRIDPGRAQRPERRLARTPWEDVTILRHGRIGRVRVAWNKVT